MIELKNTGRSPRVVYDIRNKAVVVEPGAKKFINITDEAALILVGRGVFEIVKTENAPTKPAESASDEDLEINSLRRDAEDLGVKVDKRWNAKRLQLEIDNALHDTDSRSTPNKIS